MVNDNRCSSVVRIAAVHDGRLSAPDDSLHLPSWTKRQTLSGHQAIATWLLHVSDVMFDKRVQQSKLALSKLITVLVRTAESVYQLPCIRSTITILK